jgi:hypothetical protein
MCEREQQVENFRKLVTLREVRRIDEIEGAALDSFKLETDG